MAHMENCTDQNILLNVKGRELSLNETSENCDSRFFTRNYTVKNNFDQKVLCTYIVSLDDG